MSYTTILTGNGIGRAVEPTYFPLDAGIQSVWDDTTDFLLSDQNKETILHCLPDLPSGGRPIIPKNENELATLHKVVTACDLIGEVENNNSIWLTDLGRDFPLIIDHFIGRVAHYFHCYSVNNPDYDSFIAGIAEYIRNNESHLITLNYDNLLYQPLIEEEVLAGYDGYLLDGFTGLTFDESNMIRHRKGRGWYIHLHGSPLFYNDGNSIKKLRQEWLDESFDPANILRRHIVLSHTKLKPEIISGSPLLSSYWDFFGQALSESDFLLVIGYGGADIHVNKKISDWIIRRKKLRLDIYILIIERRDGRTNEDRMSFWKRRFDPKSILKKADLTLQRMDNILQFDWTNF